MNTIDSLDPNLRRNTLVTLSCGPSTSRHNGLVNKSDPITIYSVSIRQVLLLAVGCSVYTCLWLLWPYHINSKLVDRNRIPRCLLSVSLLHNLCIQKIYDDVKTNRANNKYRSDSEEAVSYWNRCCLSSGVRPILFSVPIQPDSLAQL